MKYLVTGGCGFLGSNLASEVLRRGHQLIVFDNLYRTGADQNLHWLQKQGEFVFYHRDIRSVSDVEDVIKQHVPDVIFHCSGQVAMTTSIERPRFDFDVNVVGGLNLLEAVRKFCPQATVTFSSTNKVYGDLETLDYRETETRYECLNHPEGFPETVPLEFCSPYGCSKGAMDQYMLDYARIFNLNTVVFRHSSIYGGRQYPSFDQGWVGWFMLKAMAQARGRETSFTVAGNGKQVRDLLYVDDIIDCYFRAAEKIESVRGKAFNIGGGPSNSLSVLELIQHLGQMLNVQLKVQHLPPRQSDQKVYIAGLARIAEATGWRPKISKEQGLQKMLEWLK